MIEKLIEQQETIKGLQNNQESLIKIMKQYEDYKIRVDKAIKYITSVNLDDSDNIEDLLEILRGDD